MGDGSTDRYCRQVRFAGIGSRGQRRLGAARVALCGSGALGTSIAQGLVRAGVGFLRIIDRDCLELSNLQRQVLFDEADVAAGLPKAHAAAQKLASINSEVSVEPVAVDLDAGNIERYLGDVGLIVDGTDNFETRFLINDFAAKTARPWIFGSAVGAEGQCLPFLPGRPPCFRCLVESAPAPGTAATCETAGILGSASALVAAVQVAEALKILIGDLARVRDRLLDFDLWRNRFRELDVRGLKGEDCPVCQGRHFEFLDGGVVSQSSRLCGRQAVQIAPPRRQAVDWNAARARLEPVTPVEATRFMLRFQVEGLDVTLFPDGRAIVKGTDDIARARSVYARYVGA